MSSFEKFNRPHNPNEDDKILIYSLYKLLFNSNLPLHAKYRTLESLVVNIYPLKVVCISKNAAESIKENKSAKGLRRGHPFSRVDRAKALFEIGTEIKDSCFFDFYFKNDTVALITSEENKKDGTEHWSTLFAVTDGHFTKGSYSVYASKADKKLVEEILA